MVRVGQKETHFERETWVASYKKMTKKDFMIDQLNIVVLKGRLRPSFPGTSCLTNRTARAVAVHLHGYRSVVSRFFVWTDMQSSGKWGYHARLEKQLKTVKASRELGISCQRTCVNILLWRFWEDQCAEDEIVERERSSLQCKMPAARDSYAEENTYKLTPFKMISKHSCCKFVWDMSGSKWTKAIYTVQLCQSPGEIRG